LKKVKKLSFVMSELSFVSLNIEGHKHLDLVLPFLQRGHYDVINLQEVFETDMPYLEQQLQARGVFVPLMNMDVPTHHIGYQGVFGIATFTNLPVTNTHTDYYVGDAGKIPNFQNGGPNASNRALLHVEVTKDGQSFTILNTHFTWSPDGNPVEEQRRDMKALLQKLGAFPEFVLSADFNAPREGEIFQMLTKLYHANVPAEVTTTIDANLHKAGNLQLVVDNIVNTPQYQVGEVKVHHGVSDHCAVSAQITKA
jgi:endonuclease/exonuclease/phosphatase family metal-dependent hydrolase